MLSDDNTDELLQKVAAGDPAVGSELLRRHRDRLIRMVALRVDRRTSGRFDPSDVVQEALVIASDRLVDYAQQQPIGFYPWLRKIAWEQLIKFHERHRRAQKRSVEREERQALPLNNKSNIELAHRLADNWGTASEHVVKLEQRDQVREAVASLKPPDREILALRYLERMGNAEIAAVLNISVEAVRTRHFRAVQRLHRILQDRSFS